MSIFPSRLRPIVFCVTAALIVPVNSSLHAASGTWGVVTSGTWGDPASWVGATVADGADNTADFNQVDVPIGGIVVSLETPRTIGNLIFGDLDASTAGSWTINDNAVATNVLTLQTTAGVPAITVNALGIGASATISAAIAGSNGMEKLGVGILALTGTNTYTGNTTLSAGVLRINSAFSLGDASSVTIINSATLQALTTITSSRNFQLGSGGSTIQIDPGAIYTLNGNVTDGAAVGTLNKTGAGTLTVTGANTFTGGTVISSGTIILGGTSGLGAGGANLAVNAGVLNLNGNSFTVAALSGSAGAIITSGTLAPAVTLTAGTSSSTTYAGSLQNTGTTVLSLTKQGSGTLTLNGSSNYTGTTLISAGILELGNSFALGNSTFDTAGPGLLSLNSLTSLNLGGLTGSTAFILTNTNGVPVNLTIGTGNINSTYAGVLSGSANLTKTGTGTFVLANTGNTFGGTGKTITLTSGFLGVASNGSLGDAANTVTFNGGGIQFMTGAGYDITASGRALISSGSNFIFDTNGNDIAFANAITTGTLGGLTKSGSGTLTLTASNNYRGATTVNGGVLKLGNAQALGPVAAGITVNNTGTLDLNGNSLSFGPLTTGTFGLITSTGTGQILLSSSSAINTVHIGTITDGSSQISFTKTGVGNLNLRGTNTYTGPTTITSGTLVLDFNPSLATVPGNVQMLYTGSPNGSLILGGGALQITARASITNAQAFGTTILTPGASFAVTNARASTSNVGLAFGNVIHGLGATIDFTANGTGNTASLTNIFTTNVNNMVTNGIIGGWATFNNVSWAARGATATTILSGSGNNLIALAAAGITNTFAPTTNTDMTASLVAGASGTTNSIRFNNPLAATLTLSGSNVNTTGGILTTVNVVASPSVITGGSLTSGTNELFVIQNNAAGTLTIDSSLTDRGATAVALTKSGAGTVLLGGTNTFTGGLFINNGIVQLSNASALNASGTNAVLFSNNAANANATLRLSGNNATISSLATVASPAGTKIVENAGSNSAVLTVSGTASTTYAGTVQNGAGAGTLGITKNGSGTLTLSGNNTYSGNTTVNVGTLAFRNNTPTSTLFTVASGATLDVSGVLAGLGVGSGSTLTGGGSVTGSVALNAGGTLSPGGDGVVGTLTVGSITINTNSTLNMEFGIGVNDLLQVSTLNGLTINGGNVNLFEVGTANPFMTTGTFNLIAYTGAVISGTSVSSLQVGNPSGLTYNFGQRTVSGTNFITVAIAPSNALTSNWNVDQNDTWSNGANWTNGLPDGAGNIANFGNKITAPRTVTLDGDHTVGILTFSNTNSYTLASGTGGSLTLDGSGANPAQIAATIGSHTVAAGIHLSSSNTIVNISAGNTLTLAGIIDGISNLVKSGGGLLDLSGSNSYTGATRINAGTVRINSAASLGDLAATTQIGAGVLDVSTSFATTRNFLLADTSSTVQVEAGATYTASGTFSNGSSAGALNKSGSGTLILTATNTYSLGTTVRGGILNFAGLTSLGTAGITVDGGTLQFAAGNTGDISVRPVTVGVNGGTIDTNGNNVNLANAIGNGGGGTLTITTGTGNLTFNAVSTYTGGTILRTGTVTLANTGSLSETITFQGGTLRSNYAAANRLVLNTPFIGAGQTGTIIGSNRVSLNGLQGSGTLNILSTSFGAPGTSGFAFTGDFSGFNGIINVSSTGSTPNGIELFVNGGTPTGFSIASLSNATVNLINFGRMGTSTNSTGQVFTIGALFGDATSVLVGTDLGSAGISNYTIGGLNTSGTFAGTIMVGLGGGGIGLTKVGTGTLTLTGTNSHNFTNVNNGVLQFVDVINLGLQSGTTLITGGILQPLNSGTNALQTFVVTGTAGTIQIDPGLTFETDGNVVGTGNLTKTGAGNLVVGGATSFTGETIIRSGTLTITNSSSLFGSTLNYNNQGGVLSIAGGLTATTFGGLRGSQDLALTSDAGPIELSVGQNNQNTTYTGVLSSSGTLTKVGNGALTLTGTNTYSGGTTIVAGTLKIAKDVNMGALSGDARINGGTLQITTSFATLRNFLLGGTGSAILVDPGVTYTLNGTIADFPAAAPGSLIKTGLGTLVLTNNNTYTGATGVNGGTLLLDYTTQNTSKIASTAALNLGGGTLNLRANSVGTTQTVGDVFLNSGGSTILLDGLTNSGSAALVTGSFAGSTGATLNIVTTGNASLTTTGTTAGPDATGIYGSRITYNGNDWATSLSGASPFLVSAYAGYQDLTVTGTGDTFNSRLNGSTVLAMSATTNSLKVITAGPGGQLDLGGTNSLTLTSGGLLFAGADDYAINNGALTTDAPVNPEIIVHHYGAGLLTINAVVANSLTGPTSFTKTGPGTTVLTGSNTYTGTTYLNGGVLSVSNNSQLGDFLFGASVSLNGGTLRATDSFILANAAANRRGVILSGAGGTIDVTGTNILIVSGVISQGSAGAGITKSGSGTLTLQGANTYTGPTNVNGGKLVVQGSIGGSSLVTVNSGGTLGGTSTVGVLVVKSGGTVSPGLSPGTLTAGNTTFEAGGNYLLELRTQGTGAVGTDWDRLSITGALDISGLNSGAQFVLKLQTLDLANANNPLAVWDPTVNHVWASIVPTTGGFVGSFSPNQFNVDTTGFLNPIAGTFSVAQNGNNLDLQYLAAVPEPQTWAMMIAGAGLLLVARRKRSL